jgi:hypothetical protein
MKRAAWKLKGDLNNIILATGDFNSPFHQAQDMYLSDKIKCKAISAYIQALYALHDYKHIVEIVEDLRQIEANQKVEATSTSQNPPPIS